MAIQEIARKKILSTEVEEEEERSTEQRVKALKREDEQRKREVRKVK